MEIFCVCCTFTFKTIARENKLQKEHDVAVYRLKEQKKVFERTLEEYLKKVKEFSTKDRISEADKYVSELEDISQKIDEFRKQVSGGFHI